MLMSAGETAYLDGVYTAQYARGTLICKTVLRAAASFGDRS